MSLIKSNSTLIAFGDLATNGANIGFNYLNHVQNISFDISSNRLNNKFIGSEKIINNQFVSPEVNLNINFLQQSDLYNEQIFGIIPTSDYSVNISTFYYLIRGFINTYAFILFSDLESSDLIYQIKNSGYNESMMAISFEKLYLNNYSFSYKINNHATVSASFLSNNLKIANLFKINDDFYIQAPNDINKKINSSAVSNFTNLSLVPANQSLVYSMKNLSFTNTFASTLNPGPNINTFLDGLIQSLDFSFQLNRQKIYSFQDYYTNSTLPIYRGVILPIIGSLKIAGISKNFVQGNLNNIFTTDNKFNMTLTIEGKDINAVTTNFTELFFEDIAVEKFNYSLDINGMLNYSIDCSFQITAQSGFKFKNYNIESPYYSQIVSSNFEMQTSDNFVPYAHI